MKRVGIVGCGGIANTHAWVLERIEDVEIVAFADIIIDRAKEVSNKYTAGKAAVYGSLEGMLDKANLDILHICTPHYLHIPMALEAMKKGVTVFCEKPPAISMEEFEKLAQMNVAQGIAENVACGKIACEKILCKNQPQLGFCFQNRYNETTRKLDEIVSAGDMGEVIGARAFVTWRRDADYYQTDWKGKLATEGGGALINQSIHTLDLMLRYLGKPEQVKATLSNHHLEGIIEVEDTVEAWMTFEGGKRACFYATTAYASDAPVIIELQFENGTASMMDKTIIIRKNGRPQEILQLDENEVAGKSYWGNGHLACIKDFYERCDSGERFQNDLEGVRNTMETMMRIYDYR